MKPNFALNLTHENIGLLHRTSRGWLEIGVAALDAPDMGEALSYLRRSALGLSPAGITTKLVIPGSQILYDEIEAPGPDAASRRAQIAKALDGRTPYAVEDLVFDWSGDGPRVQVAVVARETLQEAEQFAAQYRFNPVSFVAIPENGTFAGEPWFGPSELAAGLLSGGERVERDVEPIRIVAREMPRAEPPAAVVAQQEPTPIEAPATPEPAPEPEPVQVPVPAPLDLPEAEPRPAPGPEAEPLPEPEPAPIPAPMPEPPAEPEPLPEPEPQSIPGPDIFPEAEPITDEVAALPSVLADDLASGELEAAVPAAFASRRNPEAAPGLGPADLPPSRLSPRGAADPAATGRAPKGKGDATGQTRSPGLSAKRPSVPAAVGARKPDKATSGLVTAPSIPGLGARRPKVAVPLPAARTAPADAAPAAKPGSMGAFGSRTASPQRGKPRHLGLILTAALLLLLAVVAAWSSFYLASSGAPESGTEVATAEPAPAEPATPEPVAEAPAAATAPAAPDTAATDLAAAAPDPADVPAVDQEMLADMQDPADLAAAASQSEPVPAAAPAPETGTEAAAAIGADFGQPAEAQDEIFLSSMDTPPSTAETVALPRPEARPDALPAAQLPPPPFGTLYQFDENGMIVPTPEGILTPDGVLLVAGRPDKVPPARPATLAVPAPALATAADSPTATGAEPAVAEEAPLPSDPALAGFKPRLRPEGLAPPPAADDGAALPVPEELRFSSPRPPQRPATVAALAEEARRATEAASLSASAAAATEPQQDAIATALAEAAAPTAPLGLSVSKRPAARPKDFSRAVQAAVAEAVQPQPQPQPQVQPQEVQPEVVASVQPAVRAKPSPPDEPTIAPSPEEEAEPEVASAAPAAPIRGSVAKQATFANAINLSKINLIGVYGTQSNRYALIRQANGRFKKVKVGDRIDGGVVAAITATEVRYQKGGRMIALAMPKG